MTIVAWGLQVGSDVATQEPLWELSFGGETVETFVARPADESSSCDSLLRIKY